MERTFVSLYSGCGGLDLGFVSAGFRPVWANDIDPDAVATYNSIPDLTRLGHRAICGDIRVQSLPAAGTADLVIGGPPCQGFSVAGRMDPNDPRSRHVWDFLGVVKRVQPRAFVMENVKNLAVNARWAGLRAAITGAAERLGYTVTLLLLNASHFGVPQARERMFFVGLASGRGAVRPIPTSAHQPPTVRNALLVLPPWGSPGNDSMCTARVTLARNPVLRRSPYAGMLFNGQGRPLALDRPALTLPASMGGNRTPIVDQEELTAGADPWVKRYHAYLMRGGAPFERAPERLRRLTVQEAAAIQTFPNDVSWAGPQSAQYRQIGNAVPPRLAEAVARAVGAALDGPAGDAIDPVQTRLELAASS